MDLVAWGIEALIVLLLLIVLPIVWLTVRRRWLSRQGATFDCSLRLRDTTPGAGWVLGVARYRENRLEWFPSFGLSLRPRVIFTRGEVRAGSQRGPTPVEAVVLFDKQRIVQFIGASRTTDIAMEQEYLTGVLSWLESSPPGLTYRESPS